MRRAVEGTILAVGALLATVPNLFLPNAPSNARERCNVKVADARLLGGSELAALLASSPEPVLVRGFRPPGDDYWPCASVEQCFHGEGQTLLIGVSTGGAIGDQNPERALTADEGLEMSVRDYTAALRNRSLPADAYVFYSTRGTALERRFAPLRTVFGQLLDAQQPELRRLRETSPDLAEAVSNVSMRFALGGLSTGSSWHSHGPALLSVLVGHKTWFIRDPSRKLPDWLEQTWPATAAQSTEAWLRAAMMASPTGRADAWLQHIWMCTQSAEELMYVPETLRHAIHNEEETLAISVQVDMLVRGDLLHATATHGHVDATRLLLESGADVTAKAANGGTPLHHAAFFGHLGVAKLLIEAGAELGAKNDRGDTPLQVASQDNGEMIKLLSGARRKAKRRKPAA